MSMPGEIIDADGLQAQSNEFRVGKHIGDISRMSEGKTWNIIGTLGPYLKIRTHNNNGCANTRLISVDAYNTPDRYPSRLPVYRYPVTEPIIDADACQIARTTPRRIAQPEIIIAAEVAEQ